MPLIAAPPSRQPSPLPAPVPPEPPRRAWRTAVIWGLIAAFGGGSLYIARLADQRAAEQKRAAQASYRLAEVRRGALERKIRIEGVTSATNAVMVTAPQLSMPESGREMAILTLPPSGSRIAKDALLVEFDSQSLRDHIDDVRDMVQDRENALTRRRVELELASETLEQRLREARGQLEKAQLDLRTLEVRSAIRQQLMKLAAEEAQANLERLLQEREILAESQRANLRAVEIARDLELLHLNRHVKDLPRYSIHAPMDGMVVLSTMRTRGGEEMTIRVGDQVRPGQPILRVVDPDSLQLEAPVNQADAAKFEPGQLATIGFDAYPGVRFRGRVASIGAIASTPGRREQFYIRSVPVRVELLDHDNRILPDLTAYADVVVERQEDVLIAPASAIQEENGKNYVYVGSGEGFEKREVRLGTVSNTEAAILDGLSEGDRVRIR